MKGHNKNNAPFDDAGGPPVAPTIALPTARPPIPPATTPPALAVPIAYKTSPRESRQCAEVLSANTVSLLRTAWEDLKPSLDHQT